MFYADNSDLWPVQMKNVPIVPFGSVDLFGGGSQNESNTTYPDKVVTDFRRLLVNSLSVSVSLLRCQKAYNYAALTIRAFFCLVQMFLTFLLLCP